MCTLHMNQTLYTTCAKVCCRVPSTSVTVSNSNNSLINVIYDQCWACNKRSSIANGFTCTVLRRSVDGDCLHQQHQNEINIFDSSSLETCHFEQNYWSQVKPCSSVSVPNFFRSTIKIGQTLLLLMLICILWLPKSGHGASISSSSSLRSFASALSSSATSFLSASSKNSTLNAIETFAEINRKLEHKIEQLELKFQNVMKENYRQQQKHGRITQQLHNIQQQLSDNVANLSRNSSVNLLQRISSSTTSRPLLQSRQRLPGRSASLLLRRSVKRPHLMVLYHHCSSGYVQPLPGRNRLIAVKPPRRSGLFQLKPLHHLHQNWFAFQTRNGRTLCLNKHTQPILKNLRNISNCALEIIPLDGGIVQFRLATNKTSYVRFNDRGKPVSGQLVNEQDAKHDTCTHFVRRMEHVVKFAAELKQKLSKKRRALQQMRRELESTKQLLKESRSEFERHQRILLTDLKHQAQQQQVDKELLQKLDKVEQQLLKQHSKHPQQQISSKNILSPVSLPITTTTSSVISKISSTSVASTVLAPVAFPQTISNSVFESKAKATAASNLKQPTLEEEIHNWALSQAAKGTFKRVASVKRKRHQSYLFNIRHKVTMTWPNDLDIN